AAGDLRASGRRDRGRRIEGVTVTDLAERIEAAFDGGDPDPDLVEEAVGRIDRGEVRVAEPAGDGWTVNEWAKKAILLYFRVREMETIEVGPYEYHDKIPLKRGWVERNVRVVTPATVRHGAYVSPGTVLMPFYVNIGAWIGSG